jgi:CRP-like cAMP-binding protein
MIRDAPRGRAGGDVSVPRGMFATPVPWGREGRMAKERERGEARNPAHAVNRLLAMTPAPTLARLQQDLEVVTLAPHTVLAEPGGRLSHAYFPHEGAISVLSVTRRGMIEAATVGKEGFIGFAAVLGESASSCRLLARAGGTASRLPIAALRAAAGGSPQLETLLLGFVRCVLVQLVQSAACNALHTVRERCARGLLTARDRAGGDRFALTQAALAEMLGVQRPSVTIVARGLQEEGLIRYSRGAITIADAARLEGVACECYFAVRAALAAIDPGAGPRPGDDRREP